MQVRRAALLLLAAVVFSSFASACPVARPFEDGKTPFESADLVIEGRVTNVRNLNSETRRYEIKRLIVKKGQYSEDSIAVYSRNPFGFGGDFLTTRSDNFLNHEVRAFIATRDRVKERFCSGLTCGATLFPFLTGADYWLMSAPCTEPTIELR